MKISVLYISEINIILNVNCKWKKNPMISIDDKGTGTKNTVALLPTLIIEENAKS